ncbi:MAG: sialate O-acetylesterase [Candidatus Marinimicrobia bacterium]|nr:sialate O-acetylesterase [Candidatus Neomarinimicrobiota bacterium]
MKKKTIVLYLLIISLMFCDDTLRVSGRVTLNKDGLSNVRIADTQTGPLGYYAFAIPRGSDTTFSPVLNSFIFEPANVQISAGDSIHNSINFRAARQKKKVLVIAGQSNANSNGTYRFFIPDSIDKKIPYFLASNGVEHGLATLGLISKFGVWDRDNFGIETLLGRTLYKHYEDSLAVMKFAWGGTSLVDQWKEGGEIWLWFKEMHRHAVDSMRAEGYEPEYIGFFWYQGESDRTPDRAPVYGDSLYHFVGRVRELLPNSSEVDALPFICVRILWNPASMYEETVRQAQMGIAHDRAFSAWVDIDDCDSYRISEDNLHYNGNALNRIGYKMATCYLDLIRHPIDSATSITVDIMGSADTSLILSVKGDTTFYDNIRESSYHFPAKTGDSLQLELLLSAADRESRPDTISIPFVYPPSVIPDSAYTFDVHIKTSISGHQENSAPLQLRCYPNPFNSHTTVSFQLRMRRR